VGVHVRINKLHGLVANDLSGFIWSPEKISDETDRMAIGDQEDEI
jgi:hypothetical protein